jgi:lipoprotein NlpD
MRNIHSAVTLCLVLAMVACSANPPAPVIDRMGSSATKATTNKPSALNKQTKQKTEAKSADWRPDNYTVKKGDTLISIGLEYGYDYKEIAQTNDLNAPYNIKVGQTLKLKQTKDKLPAPENKLVQENSDGVSTYALNSDPSASATTTNSASPVATMLNSPKAIREPYSDAAFNKAPPLGQPSIDKAAPNVAATKNAPATLADNVAKTPADLKSDNKTDSTDDIDWAWPTKGKISVPFNESSNKGIDIAGSAGQAINAAAGGKVIYSGSDLRGYGKLVIIKHNANYLSVYAHNSNLLVKEGQQVTSGQKIAEMGSSDSDKVKLHFEIRKLGKSVDPSKYLATN